MNISRFRKTALLGLAITGAALAASSSSSDSGYRSRTGKDSSYHSGGPGMTTIDTLGHAYPRGDSGRDSTGTRTSKKPKHTKKGTGKTGSPMDSTSTIPGTGTGGSGAGPAGTGTNPGPGPGSGTGTGTGPSGY